MARTDAEHLQELKEHRDELMDKIRAFGGGETKKSVMGVGDARREVEKERLKKELREIREEIDHMERKIGATAGGYVSHITHRREVW